MQDEFQIEVDVLQKDNGFCKVKTPSMDHAVWVDRASLQLIHGNHYFITMSQQDARSGGFTR